MEREWRTFHDKGKFRRCGGLSPWRYRCWRPRVPRLRSGSNWN